MFKSKAVKAIRHKLTPTFGLSFTPDYTQNYFGIYDSYINDQNDILNENNDTIFYKLHDQNLFRDPTGQERKGRLNIGILNNVEMKIASKKDTITGTKKLKLIENMRFNTNYDLSKDSLKWAPLQMNGFTNITKNISFNYSSNWSFYAIDSVESSPGNGNFNPIIYNKSHFAETRRPIRHTAATATLTLKLNSKQQSNKKNKINSNENDPVLQDIKNNPDHYIDFNIPWSLNIDYNFSFSKNYFEPTISNIVNARGDIKITQNWKIGYITGYNFTKKELSTTSLSIFRDLHCWDLSANVIPFGTRRSYTVTLKVKSAVLQDLKLSRQRQSLYNPNF